MITESTTLQERMASSIPMLNAHPKNQLCSEKWGGHYEQLQTFKKLLWMNPVATEKWGEKPGGAPHNYQLCTEKWGGHHAFILLFVDIIIGHWRAYTQDRSTHNSKVFQTNSSVRNFSAMRPDCFRKCRTKLMESHISCTIAFCCQQKSWNTKKNKDSI